MNTGNHSISTRKLALLGIDGSGKSTIIRELIRLSTRCKNKFSAFSCTNFHDTPDVPMADLSRAFDAVSQLADKLDLPDLKYISLYLKMTLVGPIEKFLMETYRPRSLVSERNAIIDSLVYGGFYAGLKPQPAQVSREDLEKQLKEEVENNSSLSYGAVLHWLELENIRLGRAIDFWQLPGYLRSFYEKPLEEFIGALSVLFRTRLPDTAIFLDVEPEMAAQRLSARGKRKELHEKSSSLAKLRERYIKTLERIKHYPIPRQDGETTMQVITITAGEKGVNDLLKEIMEKAGLA